MLTQVYQLQVGKLELTIGYRANFALLEGDARGFCAGRQP